MNKSFLNKLLRRRHGKSAELPDAASLAALVADGPVSNAQRSRARVAQSPRNADLYRFARDLHPLSRQLAGDLRAQFEDSEIAAHRPRRHRAVHVRRPWRAPVAVAAMAASLVVAVALWAWHYRAESGRALAAASPEVTTQVPDRIFAALDDRAVATRDVSRGDEIFRSDFHRAPSGRRNNG